MAETKNCSGNIENKDFDWYTKARTKPDAIMRKSFGRTNDMARLCGEYVNFGQ